MQKFITNKETSIQHVFVSQNNKCVSLCDKNMVLLIDGSKINAPFDSLKSEFIDPLNICEKCSALKAMLDSRETEIQRYYDSTVNEFHDVNKEVKKLESLLKKKKLSLIKLQSEITKAELKAKESGIFDFL